MAEGLKEDYAVDGEGAKQPRQHPESKGSIVALPAEAEENHPAIESPEENALTAQSFEVAESSAAPPSESEEGLSVPPPEMEEGSAAPPSESEEGLSAPPPEMEEGLSVPPPAQQRKSEELLFQEFIAQCESCDRCGLAAGRSNVVVWRGNIKAPLMIIGEGPGAEEDLQGKPFVGRSGQLLDQLLLAWDIREENFHICNIVKCRPPENRAPKPDEAENCRPLLTRQFNLVKPRVILLMGATAYKYFTHDNSGITKVRGKWIEKSGFWIMPTFHPAYILRDPRRKNDLWEDMGAARRKLTELKLLPELDT